MGTGGFDRWLYKGENQTMIRRQRRGHLHVVEMQTHPFSPTHPLCDRCEQKVNFLSGLHECNWYSMFNVGGLAEPLAFGVRCDVDGDPDGGVLGFGLGDGEGRTVTDLIMPRESSICR